MAGPPRQVLRVYPCAMSYLQHLSVGARMFWRTGSSTVSTLATGSDADPDPWIRIRIKMCRNMPWQKIKITKFFNFDFFLLFYNFLLIFIISFLPYIRYKHKYILTFLT